MTNEIVLDSRRDLLISTVSVSAILVIITFVYSKGLTDTGEDSKLVPKRKRPKVNTLFSSLSSDEYYSGPSRKYSRPLLDVSACIG